MNIKNYTTGVSWKQTIGEIEGLLSEFGANAIMKEYTGDSRVRSLSFKISTDFGVMGYKLPADSDRVFQILKNQKKHLRNEALLHEQAERVAWRVIKDWLHAQFSLVFIGQAKVEQILLPYMYDGKQTFYERVEAGGFQLGLSAPKEKQSVNSILTIGEEDEK